MYYFVIWDILKQNIPYLTDPIQYQMIGSIFHKMSS